MERALPEPTEATQPELSFTGSQGHLLSSRPLWANCGESRWSRDSAGGRKRDPQPALCHSPACGAEFRILPHLHWSQSPVENSAIMQPLLLPPDFRGHIQSSHQREGSLKGRVCVHKGTTITNLMTSRRWVRGLTPHGELWLARFLIVFLLSTLMALLFALGSLTLARAICACQLGQPIAFS